MESTFDTAYGPQALREMDEEGLARALIHARNVRDAYAADKVPGTVLNAISRIIQEQGRRRTQRASFQACIELMRSNDLNDDQIFETLVEDLGLSGEEAEKAIARDHRIREVTG